MSLPISLLVSLLVSPPFWCHIEAIGRAAPTLQVVAGTASPRTVWLQSGVVRRVLMSVYTVGVELFPWTSTTVMRLMAQHSIRMNIVVRARNPFEIFRAVVRLVSIEMVYLKRFITRLAVEGKRYESGYLPLTVTISPGQQNMLIANPLGSWLQYSPRPCALPGSITPNASEVRRAVETKVSGNGEPAFGNHQYIVSQTGVFVHEEEMA